MNIIAKLCARHRSQYRKSFISCSPINYLLFLIISLPHQTLSYDDPTNQFSNHEIITPKIINGKRTKRDISFLQDQKYDDKLRLAIKAFNQTFDIILERNNELFSSNYFEKHHENGQYINRNPYSKDKNHCHYQGHLFNLTNSWASISTCNQSISGVFSNGSDIFYIHSNENQQHLLFREKDLKFNSFKCGSDDINLNLFPGYTLHKTRHKRSIIKQEPYSNDYKTRYVELIIVNDVKVFKENKSNRDVVYDRSKRIANIVNGLYRKLNIFIALVGVITWTENDEIKMSPDGDQTLNNFLHYRRERLLPEHPNDNAQLITGSTFDGGVVGKALKGPICTYEYSGGVNTDHSHVIGIVATTMAHELGHNFGMEHDTEKCKCFGINDKCIMAPSSSSISPKNWSSCSHEYLEDALRHGMDFCLRNLPKEVEGPICGNGFLEEGEQCDCGLADFCDNKCCNATSCTLMPGAACASGTCCDISKCKIFTKEQNRVCRPATNECDLVEICDGFNEFCPENVYVQDGTSCMQNEAFCYEGQCNSLGSQCKLLWGQTGEISDVRCFLQNTKGNATGNCGYNLKTKAYTPCKSNDIMCGTLHCNYKNEKLEFGMESAAILTRSYINLRSKVITCRSAIIDLGLDSPNPGLAPNGAKCSADSMCVNQQCLPINSFLSKNSCFQNCNQNGYCDNKGRCHCFPGFAPPYCEFALPGGYFVTVALYIIFLCILPLTAVGALLIYHYNERIKTWWFVKARTTAIKSRAKQVTHRKPPRPPTNFDAETLEISNPIPIENEYEDIKVATFPRNNTREPKTNIKDVPFTKSESSSKLLRPVRPAPPPPNQLITQENVNFSRSSAPRYSTKSLGRKNSLPRPTQPPPRPPRVNDLTKDSLNKSFNNNVKVNTGNSVSEKWKPSTLNLNEMKNTSLKKKIQQPQKNVSNSNDSKDTSSKSMINNANRSVASLTKKFETLNQ